MLQSRLSPTTSRQAAGHIKLESMRRFFVEKNIIRSGRARLTGTDAKHVRTVLRMKPGEVLCLFDGKGSDYHARIEEITQQAVKLEVLERFPSISESPVDITIAQALLKGRKMDRVVRQVTELGVKTLIPVMAERSVVRVEDHHRPKKEQRWKTIAHEALKQCGRAGAPLIEPFASLETVVNRVKTFDLGIIFHDDDVARPCEPAWVDGPQIRTILALVGPEGGFAPAETMAAARAGFVRVTLGPRTLKADTAVVTACALLQHAFGDVADLFKKGLTRV